MGSLGVEAGLLRGAFTENLALSHIPFVLCLHSHASIGQAGTILDNEALQIGPALEDGPQLRLHFRIHASRYHLQAVVGHRVNSVAAVRKEEIP